MGYTNYWYRKPELNEKKFNLFVADVKKIYEKAKKLNIPLADGWGEEGTEPIANDEMISFNGVGDNSHETMQISRTQRKLPFESGKEELCFGFCKTARKLYDVIVTAVLIAFKHYFPHAKISSDGNNEDFEEGRNICNELFGYGSKFKLREED